MFLPTRVVSIVLVTYCWDQKCIVRRDSYSLPFSLGRLTFHQLITSSMRCIRQVGLEITSRDSAKVECAARPNQGLITASFIRYSFMLVLQALITKTRPLLGCLSRSHLCCAEDHGSGLRRPFSSRRFVSVSALKSINLQADLKTSSKKPLDLT